MTYCVGVSAVPSPETGYRQHILELQYLTNLNDTKEVTGISFLEAPEYSFIATENEQFNSSFTFFQSGNSTIRGESIGRYSLRKVYLYMDNYYIGDWNGEVELKNARITFSDGSTSVVNLGRILLYSDKQEVPAMDMMSSSSSNEGTTKTTLSVHQELSELKLESPMLQEADSALEITINSIAYDELKLLKVKRGDHLIIECNIKDLPEGMGIDVYDFRPKLSYTKEDGTQGYTRLYNITKRRYFYSYFDALKYLIRRGGF